jgi:predicted nucleic acid-binding protein
VPGGRLGREVILEHVALEVATVLRVRLDLSSAVDVLDRLLGAAELEFVPCSELLLPTMETFRSQGPQGLSFVDAAMVTVARRHPPGFVATFDRGFGGVAEVTPVRG